jgi:hypothetical protein
VEENNIENTNGKYCHCTKEKLFQNIAKELRILDVVGDKENDESVFRLEIPHPIKYNSILEKSIIDCIETWF